MLKVMIVDNESAIRKGLVHCIHWGDLGCEIAAQADDGMMALEQIPVIQPNIVISDIRMPGAGRSLSLPKSSPATIPASKSSF